MHWTLMHRSINVTHVFCYGCCKCWCVLFPLLVGCFFVLFPVQWMSHLVKPFEANSDLWIRATQIKVDWLTDPLKDALIHLTILRKPGVSRLNHPTLMFHLYSNNKTPSLSVLFCFVAFILFSCLLIKVQKINISSKFDTFEIRLLRQEKGVSRNVTGVCLCWLMVNI